MELKQLKCKQDSQDYNLHILKSKFQYNVMPILEKLYMK